MSSHRDIVGAFLLIAFGLLLLLNNLNLVPWMIWHDLWQFWPVLLVLWGLQMIFEDSSLGQAILTLFTLVVILYILGNLVARYDLVFRRWWLNNFPESFTRPSVTHTPFWLRSSNLPL